MLDKLKLTVTTAVKYVVNKIIAMYEAIKLALGYSQVDLSTGTVNLDGETYDPSDEEDIEALEIKAEEITQTVIDTCSVIFLIIVSCLLVNEFWLLILFIIEVTSVYFIIKTLWKEFTSREEEAELAK